jgi:CubicO group peptidase (beta-lactamase class C family)
VADLVQFSRACLHPPDGDLGDALVLARRPVIRKRVSGMGLGWMIRTRTRSGLATETTWHNGGTYGTASFLAVDAARSIAVVSFGNTGPGLATPLDGPSWALFDEAMASS